MNNFRKWNLVFGWAAFAVSAVVYILTMEPTASLWDCAEFIATSYKLEVGHPPGAPMFMMIARFFTIFAASPAYAAVMVNLMSAFCSAFTILFLFWTITHLARKIYAHASGDLTAAQVWTVMGAGLIGSLAFTFTDTFWFSAVEGEVYAMSSMFTALVFWAMLQWERVADEPRSSRWLILIAYLMGLSIGVHLLNLLTIPALVFVYYFRKYPKVTFRGVVKATLAAGAILIAINSMIIPYTVALGAWFDKLFVNGFGLPVNSGMIFFSLALFALAAVGIWITHKRGKVLWNTMILCTTVILLGYSSYASVVIRASANPPMNSNNPDNPYALLSLLNREQYGGERPMLYGPYYNSVPSEHTYRTVTWYDPAEGRYRNTEMWEGYKYPDDMKFFFPRMFAGDQKSIDGYRSWSDMRGRPVTTVGGERIMMPTFGENLKYFFNYQFGFMYWRYLMWNFSGRQSDIQSTGQITDGNWITGIGFIDAMHLGPQSDLPSEMASNKGHNTYYLLPFLLGIAGLLFQFGRDKRNFTVVLWFFFLTGVALVLYLNMPPGEPRERDYVYAGSFYAFCIWIGFGVLALREALVRAMKRESVAAAAVATAVCACVPVILAAQNWDDHDRSGRYVARDLGYNYLESTLPGSIIMNFGDNDTYPLWYNQEVEGVRPDVKVMNMSYLGASWYIDQMKIASNDSEPVPFSLPTSKYTNVYGRFPVVDRVEDRAVPLREVMNFVKSDDRATKQAISIGTLDYIPARHIVVPVNRANAIRSGIVNERDSALIEDNIMIEVRGDWMDMNVLMLLDLLDNFDWSRPLFFTSPYNIESLGLDEYLQFDGFAFRLVPIRTPVESAWDVGRIDTEWLYSRLMETFRYGNVHDPRVYADNFTQINFESPQTRNAFARLAKQLIAEGDTTRAVAVLDAAIEKMPFGQIRNTAVQTISLVEAYYMAGEYDKGNAVFDQYARILDEYLHYYLRFDDRKADLITREANQRLSEMNSLYILAADYGQSERMAPIEELFALYRLKPGL